MVQLPPEMETMLMSRETCEQENNVVRPLPQ
jgi:hypothetical protein